MVEIRREFDFAIAHLERAGCVLPGDSCLWVPALGLQAIETDADLYQPVDHRHLALLIPVYDGPTPSFMTPVDAVAEIIDLVAFRLSEPRRWWRRTGLADYLGEHFIQAAVTWQKPLRVLETPLAWLNARGRGVCPLSHNFSALRDPPELRFDNAAFAAVVRRALARPNPLPRFSIRASAA